MIRKIIHIDEEKCNGCGACAEACHEGAIGMVNGKAKLLRDDYCDGLGDCLPTCPTGAITFVEREAAAYNEAAVKANMAAKAASEGHAIGGGHGMAGGCPGSRMRMMKREGMALKDAGNTAAGTSAPASDVAGARGPVQSQLANWPVQIKLAPVNAPYFDGAKLLIAADCAAYAYANFHQEFIRGKVTLIGCPKLDDIDYSKKLTEIIQNNDIKSVTIVRMEVPCCGGLEMAAKRALQNSGKFIPWQVVTIGIEGNIIE
ncbi:MAG: 4Fe-4S binding protein [Clostridia bacterium]|nr:4Fe-4S binding protein [Clostridia bacterium]